MKYQTTVYVCDICDSDEQYPSWVQAKKAGWTRRSGIGDVCPNCGGTPEGQKESDG